MIGWIGVDLDGTLADHYWPQKGAFALDRIGDPIAPMVSRVRRWLAQGIEVRVFTARVGPTLDMNGDVEAARSAIVAWCVEHIGQPLKVTATKDFALLELWDDRAVRIVHNTGEPCCAIYEGPCV